MKRPDFVHSTIAGTLGGIVAAVLMYAWKITIMDNPENEISAFVTFIILFIGIILVAGGVIQKVMDLMGVPE